MSDTQRLVYGKGRLEALSDGLFAIVLTLLVLELRVPDLPKDVAPGQLANSLAALGPTLFAFVMTFALAGAFWLLHHQLFHVITTVTRPVLLLNLVFLLFVSLLPFSTALVGRFFMHQPLVLQIYFLNQIAIGIALWSVWWACGRSRGIDERGAEHGHGFEVRVLTLVGAAVVAIGCTFIAPRATFQAFALAVILTRVAEKRLKKKVRQPPK